MASAGPLGGPTATRVRPTILLLPSWSIVHSRNLGRARSTTWPGTTASWTVDPRGNGFLGPSRRRCRLRPSGEFVEDARGPCSTRRGGSPSACVAGLSMGGPPRALADGGDPTRAGVDGVFRDQPRPLSMLNEAVAGARRRTSTPSSRSTDGWAKHNRGPLARRLPRLRRVLLRRGVPRGRIPRSRSRTCVAWGTRYGRPKTLGPHAGERRLRPARQRGGRGHCARAVRPAPVVVGRRQRRT